ncbi:MAG: hypothetical protein RBS01_01315, partial [Candidatus Dojkabacteria bacterium]|nr:hypothetical protein [Candidatus Dojkabacteria bacterium]
IIKKFNTQLFLALPLSTKIKENIYYSPIQTKKGKVSVLLSQIRTFSSKRLIYKIDEVEVGIVWEIIEGLVRLLKLPPSITRGSRG